MARKPKESKAGNDGDGIKDGPPPLGHNQLTDDQKATLTFQWKKSYVGFLAAKKKADADLKNCAKQAKAELGDDAVLTIKDMIAFETEDGEAIIKVAIERQLRVARWMNVPLGSQSDMFAEPDRTPAVDRAYAAGKSAGLAGDTLNNPHAHDMPQHERFDQGWRDGQAVHLAKIKAPADDADLRPRFAKNGGGEAGAGA